MSSPENTRVAISLRSDRAPGHGELRDGLGRQWVGALQRWSVEPVLVPNGWPDPGAFAARMGATALLLTGGNDPVGAPQAGPDADPVRDRTEGALLEHARAHGWPVLGVCRGAQFLNLQRGGRLLRPADPSGHLGTRHRVHLSPGLGVGVATVNSFHSLRIPLPALAPGLLPFALSEEGDVEGFFLPGEALAGVLWHPERRPAHPPVLDALLVQLLRGEPFPAGLAPAARPGVGAPRDEER